MGREDVQSLFSLEHCRDGVRGECCEETGVERLGEGDKVQVEGGVTVQARVQCGHRCRVVSVCWPEVIWQVSPCDN